MNRDDFNALRRDAYERLDQLSQTKGRDYAGDDDVLSNFRRLAEALELQPEQVWAVYAAKHWDAIMAYCRRGRLESEPIQGRLQDLILYCLLLLAMAADDDRAPAPAPPWGVE